MTYPLEQMLSYKVMALIVLAVFYGVYYIKMLLQKKQGIKTNQIGSRKEKKLHTVELLMSVATGGIVIVQLASVVFEWSIMPANGRLTGFLIAMMGDIIFLVSVIKMKDSWRAGIPEKDSTSLVTDGIYRFSRNPAFLGFDLMYTGMLLLYMNAATILFTAFAITMLHLQILQEEKYLAGVFGNEYIEYKKHVFRYLGRR